MNVLDAYGPGTQDEGEGALVLADGYLAAGDRELAASALDRAHGLLPNDEAIARQRRGLLDELAVEEHGLVWRYVPAGSFMMGSADGDTDERPVHPRRLAAFWMTDIPLTWTAYSSLMGWGPPPYAKPPDDPRLARQTRDFDPEFMFRELSKIRRQYCENNSGEALDWHTHLAESKKRELVYDRKPMIATSPAEAEDLAAVLAQKTSGVIYGLPTEAEWEKAARGGLIACHWSWGNEPPTRALCDFDRFGAFHLEDPRKYPANGYGLHAMCGGVAEWTADRYDALAYLQASRGASQDAPDVPDARVIRGGSWADCAAAITVSFRASRAQAGWNQPRHGGDFGAPTVGFRLVRHRL